MKRDWDIVRLILTKLEDLPDSLSALSLIHFFTDEKTDLNRDFSARDQQVSYNMELLIEAGLVVGKMSDAITLYPKEFQAERLTWAGHEFLDAIRDDTVWNKTKEIFKTKGLDMSFETIKTVATAAMTSMLGLSA